MFYDYMIYIVFDFMMAVIMFLFGMWFYKSEGKAANFLSGYNMKSADERKKYDENAMCKAYGKRMMFYVSSFYYWNNHRYPISRNWLFDCMGDMVYYVCFVAY